MKARGKCSRILVACLSLVLVLNLFSTTAFAMSASDTGSITISGVEDSVEVKAYQVINVNFDDVTGQPQTPVYKWEDHIATWLETHEIYSNYINADDNAVTEAFQEATTEEIAQFYDALAAALNQTHESGNGIEYGPKGERIGNGTIEDLPMGSYLVIIENGYKVYLPSVANLIPEWDENMGQWIMSDAVVEVKASEPMVSKTVNEKEMENANIGDTVSFKILADIPNIPENALGYEYMISDSPSDCLTIDKENVKAYGIADDGAETLLTTNMEAGDDHEDDDYEFLGMYYNKETGETNMNGFQLSFHYYKIKQYKQIRVEYNAVLNDKAVLGETGNQNEAILHYSNDPYDANKWQHKRDKTTLYTYGLDISKVKKGDHDTLLPGAEFELYANEDASEPIKFVKENEGVYRRALPSETDNTVTVLQVGTKDTMIGKLTLKGLDEQTWYLKETKAPDGYNKLEKPVPVTITDTKDGLIDGKIVSGDAEISTGVLPLLVENDDGFKLPTTGGIGTFLFTTAGIVLIGAGAILLFVVRRKKVRG